MNIGNITTAGLSSAVWTAATRTLTADPFTDAVGGAAVWTHAARTLTADPATDAGAATLVWTHATRTLTADPATDAGAATLVWTHATRTLTDPNANTQNTEGPFAGNSQSSVNQNVYGTYTQLVASLAHNVRGIRVTVTTNTANSFSLAFATGGAGSEVNKTFVPIVVTGSALLISQLIKLDASVFAKGTRLSVALTNLTAAAQVTLSWCVVVEEDNA